MKQNHRIFLLAITLLAFSCRKPCSEEPVGAEPLDNWHIQLEVRSDGVGGADLVNSTYPQDSIFFYDENENEIPLVWSVTSSGNRNRTDRYYFFKSPDDEIAFDQVVSKTFYLDFHEFQNIDRDTLVLQFMAKTVECGQILEPFDCIINSEISDDLDNAGGKIIIFKK